MDRNYTVSEIALQIEKVIFSSNLKNVSITGELSNVTYQKSGHLYFSLKDDTSVIKCAIFNHAFKGINFTLKEGNKVRVIADINYYKPNGSINFIVSDIEKLETRGLLYEKLEKLKEEYSKKGYFDETIKKVKPKLVKRLGVITSGTGAAIEDIIRTTHNRDKYVDIYLYPVKVQGEGSSAEIANAIRYFNENNDKYMLDALIVGRGGGSIEDLWAFNEKEVIEAIYSSDIFVVSAVGHETDVLLSDFVADLRASTPTQAAEQIIQEYDKILDGLNVYKAKILNIIENRCEHSLKDFENIKNSYVLNNFENRIIQYRYDMEYLENSMYKSLNIHFNNNRTNFDNLKLKLSLSSIYSKFKNSNLELNNLKEKLEMLIINHINKSKNEIETLKLKVSKHSNDDILKKGYSITTINGKIVKNFEDLKSNDTIKTRFHTGSIESIVK